MVLSGGELPQVLIEMELANDPELIIMDEPTASLDVLTRRRILGLLDRIKEERSLLVISHDASTVASLENLIVLYSGRVMEAGKTDLLLKDPRHPYTRDLLRAHPFMDNTCLHTSPTRGSTYSWMSWPLKRSLTCIPWSNPIPERISLKS